MPSEPFERLRHAPIFADLARETLHALTQGALVQRFPSQTILFRQGELTDFLHVLLEGSVELIGMAPNQREAVVEVLEPSEAFMTAAVLANATYLVAAKVLRPARIVMLAAGAVRQQVPRDSNLSSTLLRSLGRQYRAMVHQTKNLKLRTSTQRLGCYLIGLSDRKAGDSAIYLPYEKRVIASRLGMTPESLSRALSMLRKVGVESHAYRVSIRDLDALRRYCYSDPLDAGCDTSLSAA